jgi:lycopene beta-cyclase
MDATVTQLDGYRFVYVLPLASDRLLVEDTYFSNRPGLDRTVLRRRIHAYLRERGLRAAEVVREEHGVLPMPWLDEPPASDAAVGYRGGWFHPATGYSLPVATQVATTVASAPLAGVTAALRALRRQLEPQLRFARWLNRMMFACEPVHRRDLLARFYRLPDASVTRFYGLRMRWPDRLRLLSGTPPRGVPLGAVLGTRRSPSWS